MCIIDIVTWKCCEANDDDQAVMTEGNSSARRWPLKACIILTKLLMVNDIDDVWR